MSERIPPATARDLRMDTKDLWREEMITDRRIGTLRVLTPIRADGSADAARQTVFVGEAQMMTNVGALPISFEIEAKTLAQAVEGYGAAAAAAFERTVRELQDMRRQAASSIVLPGQGGFGPGGLPPGAGGGKLQMP
jgi:regulator of protease activity HflC (stomatin/prohibitin superfamily)